MAYSRQLCLERWFAWCLRLFQPFKIDTLRSTTTVLGWTCMTFNNERYQIQNAYISSNSATRGANSLSFRLFCIKDVWHPGFADHECISEMSTNCKEGGVGTSVGNIIYLNFFFLKNLWAALALQSCPYDFNALKSSGRNDNCSKLPSLAWRFDLVFVWNVLPDQLSKMQPLVMDALRCMAYALRPDLTILSTFRIIWSSPSCGSGISLDVPSLFGNMMRRAMKLDAGTMVVLLPMHEPVDKHQEKSNTNHHGRVICGHRTVSFVIRRMATPKSETAGPCGKTYS